MTPSPGSDRDDFATPDSRCPEGKCGDGDVSPMDVSVRNLDTGEVRSLLEIDENLHYPEFFGGIWQKPEKLSQGRLSAWGGWWQAQRHQNEELWKAAEMGSVDRLSLLLSSSLDATLCSSIGVSFGKINEVRMRTVSASSAASFNHRSSGLTLGSSTVGTTVPNVSTFEATDCDVLQPGSSVGAAVESRSLHGRTAMHLAASNGHSDCIETLLHAGAQLDAKTDTGFTAFHLACQRGHLGTATALFAARCDINLQTNDGETALHLAAAQGHSQLLAFLLAHASDLVVDLRNNCGQRAAEVCVDVESLRLLQSRKDGPIAVAETCADRSCQPSDSYAGRSIYCGTVLRNSRADHVRRVLQLSVRQSTTTDASGDSVPSRGSRSARPRGDQRKSAFASLHDDGIERAGPDSFLFKAVLGKGSFGVVYEVVHKKSKQVYAMKVLRKSKILGKRNLMRYAVTERNLLSYIRHPFIVRLHYAFQTPGLLVLVLQYCSGGNLAELLQMEGRIQTTLARLYMAEVLLAIEHLHDRNVIYRDLKPENIVLDEQGHAMLTDFGLSKEGVQGLVGTKSFCGSIAYLAPEILTRVGHGQAVDLYGIGVLLYECLIGHPPFYTRDRETLCKNILSATLQVPANISPTASSFISALMQRDPAKRLGGRQTSEARNHAFFGSIDWHHVLMREVSVPPASAGGLPLAQLRQRRLQVQRQSGGDAAAAITAGLLAATTGAGSSGLNGKVASPFEGRIEAQVRRMASAAPELPGWEFASGEEKHRKRSQTSAVSSGSSSSSSAQMSATRKRFVRWACWLSE